MSPTRHHEHFFLLFVKWIFVYPFFATAVSTYLHSSFHFTCDINFFVRVASIIHGDIRIMLANFFFVRSQKICVYFVSMRIRNNEMTTNASLSLLITFFSFILLIFGRENEHVKGKVYSFLNKLERKLITELFMGENGTHIVVLRLWIISIINGLLKIK